jgi:hypothetical protein
MLMPVGLVRADSTSETNERLKQALKRFPQADANKDGILTLEEGVAFREKARAARNGGGAQKNASKASKAKHRQPPPRTVSGKNVAKNDAIQGVNGLYMGHSFFRPAAEGLLKVIPDTKVVNHTGYVVFSGGAGGAPASLWKNPRTLEAGKKYLDSGKVEFMAMTYYSPDNSAIEDYAKWFDYALKKNPEISFMIALPWGKYLNQASDAQLAQAETMMNLFYNTTIQALRKKYPNNKVYFCPYGLGVYELIRRYKAGKLPGVKHLMHPDRQEAKNGPVVHILSDPLGHGSNLVSTLNALVWLQTIYNYDLSTIDKKFRIEGLPDIDLNEIAIGIHKRIAPFNATYAKGN